jgi:hypothetical protein
MEFGPFPPPIIHEIENSWGGFVLERIKPGDVGRIEVSGFHSFDEGIGFYNLLDNLNGLLRGAGILPSCIDRLVLVVEAKRTTLYVNQMFEISLQIRAKRPINAGERVGADDIAGIERVRLHGVRIPDDAGVLLLLSHNWRRAFFFDFRPQIPQSGFKREYDLEVMAGQLFSHLVYTEYFLLSEKEWDSVISAGWFPFMFLIGGLWDSLIETIRQGDSLDEDEEKIFDAFSADIDAKLAAWLTKPILNQEEQILTRAVKAFKSEDWVTLILLVCPRIEGILRRSFSSYGPQHQVVESLRKHVEAASHEKSLLFPAQLQRYFSETFFQFVDFSAGDDTLNRHTFAHGIASPGSMDRSHGLRLMLLVDHLFYCLPA